MFFKILLFMYLKEREKMNTSIYCFTPWMSATAKAGPCWARSLKLNWAAQTVTRNQIFKLSPVVSQYTQLAGCWFWSKDSNPVWDTGSPSGSLIVVPNAHLINLTSSIYFTSRSIWRNQDILQCCKCAISTLPCTTTICYRCYELFAM